MTSHGGQGEFNTDTQRVVRREKNPQQTTASDKSRNDERRG